MRARSSAGRFRRGEYDVGLGIRRYRSGARGLVLVMVKSLGDGLQVGVYVASRAEGRKSGARVAV